MKKLERIGTSMSILKYLHRCSPQKSIISCVSPMPPIMLPAIVRRLPTSAKVWNSRGCKAEASIGKVGFKDSEFSNLGF